MPSSSFLAFQPVSWATEAATRTSSSGVLFLPAGSVPTRGAACALPVPSATAPAASEAMPATRSRWRREGDDAASAVVGSVAPELMGAGRVWDRGVDNGGTLRDVGRTPCGRATRWLRRPGAAGCSGGAVLRGSCGSGAGSGVSGFVRVVATVNRTLGE
ncbi:Uncharacterised protein [Mycobacteroides abscessus]|nr:Uncharacterised protein [Mycobacteroides abscessus]